MQEVVVSSLSVGDIVLVGTADGIVYTFVMRDIARRYGILRTFRGQECLQVTHATIMASRLTRLGSMGSSGRIRVGAFLELHTHRTPRPEFIVREPLTVTERIAWISVNGERVLPSTRSDVN